MDQLSPNGEQLEVVTSISILPAQQSTVVLIKQARVQGLCKT